MPSHVPLKSKSSIGPWLAGAGLARGPGLAAAVLVGGAGLAVRGLAAAGAELEAGAGAALLGDDFRAGPDGALPGDAARAGPDGALDGALPVAGGAGAAGAAVGCAVGWGPGGSRRVDAAPADDSGVVLVFEALPEHPPANKVKATATQTASLRIGPTLPNRSGNSGRSSGWFDRDLWTASLTPRRPTLAPQTGPADGFRCGLPLPPAIIRPPAERAVQTYSGRAVGAIGLWRVEQTSRGFTALCGSAGVSRREPPDDPSRLLQSRVPRRSERQVRRFWDFSRRRDFVSDPFSATHSSDLAVPACPGAGLAPLRPHRRRVMALVRRSAINRTRLTDKAFRLFRHGDVKGAQSRTISVLAS